MTLSNLIRKGGLTMAATATSATVATQESANTVTVAQVATVAVANHPALTAEEETTIRQWLAHIEEDDPAIIAEVLDKCRAVPDALAYFLHRTEEAPAPGTDTHQTDDRHTCHTCRHLRGDYCTARRHGLNGEASHRFRPHPDLPRRCAVFVEASSC